MKNRSRPQVRLDDLRVILRRADVSLARIATELGVSRQYVHAVVHGFAPVSWRLHRDLPIALAAHLTDVDAATIRDLIFSAEPEHGRAHSVLAARVSATTSQEEP